MALKPLKNKLELTCHWLSEMLSIKFEKKVTILSYICEDIEGKDGFLSDTFMVKVNLENPKTEEMFLVLKILPDDPETKDFIKQTNIADQECKFYNLLMNSNFAAMISVANTPFPVPRVFYAVSDEDAFTLVLENMCYKGYNIHNSSEGLDTNMTKLAFKAIAIIHACGYKYIEDYGPDSLNNLKIHEKYLQILNKILLDYVKDGLDICCSLLPAESELTMKIKNLKEKDFLQRFFTEEECNLPCTITQGDCWSGQMLYNETLSAVSIIDWQFVDIANPANDLTTFLLLSSAKLVFDQDLEDVLSFYLISVNRYLMELGSSYRISSENLYESVRHSWNIGLKVFLSSVKSFLSGKKVTQQRVIDVLHFADSLNIFS